MIETKMLFKLIAHALAKAETVEEAYYAVQNAANVEGVDLPSYADYKKELAKINAPKQQ
jgi:hypothetical protein